MNLKQCFHKFEKSIVSVRLCVNSVPELSGQLNQTGLMQASFHQFERNYKGLSKWGNQAVTSLFNPLADIEKNLENSW